MLHDTILAGSRAFHATGDAPSYAEAVRDGAWTAQRLGAIGTVDAARLIRLANQWRTRYPNSPTSQEALRAALASVAPLLQALVGQTLLDHDAERGIAAGGPTVGQAIDRVFCAVAQANGRTDLTAASKFLHVVNPELFVMWDAFIRAGYGLTRAPRDGTPPPSDYARVFLPRMQQLARCAVATLAHERGTTPGQAVRALCVRGQTLAKLIDEYSYAKFSLRSAEVWDAEFR